MALVTLTSDSKRAPLGYFSPADVELFAAILDVFYIACQPPHSRRHDYWEYPPKLISINYSNPIEIGALFKMVTVDTAKWVLNRIVFYKEECEKRKLENKSLEQDVIEKRIKNVERLTDLRRKLLEEGIADETAHEILGSILNDQPAMIAISRPD